MTPPNTEHARWFAEHIEPHSAQLKTYLRGKFPSVRDVDDVVQESLVRVWKARVAHPVRSAKAFLFTVARRLAIDFVRRERRSPVVTVKDVDLLFVSSDALNADESSLKAEQIALMVEAIDALPARCREVFVLCHVEGHAQKVVAARLGISENTVGVQSARGLQKCEEFIRRRMSAR